MWKWKVVPLPIRLIRNQVPFVILRAMSDQADDTAPADFEAYLAEVIPALNQVVMGMVAQL